MNYTKPKTISDANRGWVIFFSVLFTIALVPTLIGIPIQHTLMKAEFYNDVFVKQDLYYQLPSIIAGATVKTMQEKAPESLQENLLSGLSQDQIAMMIQVALPEGWVEIEVNRNLSAILDFLNLKSQTLEIKVNLVPVIHNLSSDSGRIVVQQMLSAFPPCTADQVASLLIQLVGGTATKDIPMCSPPVDAISVLEPMTALFLGTLTKSLPDEIIIPINNPGEIAGNPTILKYYVLLRQLTILFPWICLVLGILIIAFAFRSIPFLCSSLGVPVLIASIISGCMWLILVLTGRLGLNSLGFLAGTVQTLGGIESIMAGIGEAILTRLGQEALVTTGVFSVVGFLLIILGKVARR